MNPAPNVKRILQKSDMSSDFGEHGVYALVVVLVVLVAVLVVVLVAVLVVVLPTNCNY